MFNKLVSFAIETSETRIVLVQLVEYVACLTLYYWLALALKIIFGNLNLLDFSIFVAIDELI